MRKLTVGMATYDDFDGTLFTCQALGLYHADAVREVIVVDQAPDSPAGEALRKNFSAWKRKGMDFRYVPMREAQGTTQPRQRVFDEATSDGVVCLDCHVLVAPGALLRLAQWFADHPENGDILSGPMVLNDLAYVHTHFDRTWRSQMYGTWQTDERGLDPEGEPFEIEGMGLGLFACRKNKWLGFNPHFRGFGGEELYIHDKFRQAGRRALCLPFLLWWHRFERIGGTPYVAPLYSKVRNYVLGRQELGQPLDDVEGHLVEPGGEMRRDWWEYLLSDPIANEREPGAMPEHNHDDSLDALFEFVKARPRDLNEHADAIREFAGKCESVVAFVKRKEWNALLAAGRPGKLHVYQTEKDPFLEKVHAAVKRGDRDGMAYSTTVGKGAESLAIPPIKPAELLVIDTKHHGDRLRQELERHGDQATRFIMLRGTAAFGRQAEGGGPGLFEALRPWMEARQQWRVIYHAPNQYGLTVLGCRTEDYPPAILNIWGPGKGPGTELKKLIAEMGIAPSAKCECNRRADQMDRWGVDECRRRRDEIIGWIRDGAKQWGWADKIKAAGKGVLSGLAFRLSLRDPYASLVDQAIANAAAAEAKENDDA